MGIYRDNLSAIVIGDNLLSLSIKIIAINDSVCTLCLSLVS